MRTTMLLIFLVSSLFAGSGSSYICKDNHYVMSLYIKNHRAILNGKQYKYFAKYFYNKRIYRRKGEGFTFNGSLLVVPISEGKVIVLKCKKLK